jgi:hypothetical protein
MDQHGGSQYLAFFDYEAGSLGGTTNMDSYTSNESVFVIQKTPEPTRSGSLLSFEAFS